MKLTVDADNVSVSQSNGKLTVNGVSYDCSNVKNIEVTNHGIYFDEKFIDDKYLEHSKLPYIIIGIVMILIPISYLLINIL